MTDQPKVPQREYLHTSPIAERFGGNPRPDTLCLHCPASIWYFRDGANAFCTEMKAVMWVKGSPAVEHCDAFVAAELRLNKELQLGHNVTI